MSDLALVRHLKQRIKDLEEGACRFNCRTERQAFIDGWMAALEAQGVEAAEWDRDIAAAMYEYHKGKS